MYHSRVDGQEIRRHYVIQNVYYAHFDKALVILFFKSLRVAQQALHILRKRCYESHNSGTNVCNFAQLYSLAIKIAKYQAQMRDGDAAVLQPSLWFLHSLLFT